MNVSSSDRLHTRLRQLLRANAILMWAALAGCVGALAPLLFRDGLTLLQALLFGRSGSFVEIATALPWQARLPGDGFNVTHQFLQQGADAWIGAASSHGAQPATRINNPS